MHLSQITISGVVNFPQILLVGQITKPTVKGPSRGDFSASGLSTFKKISLTSAPDCMPLLLVNSHKHGTYQLLSPLCTILPPTIVGYIILPH